ncbi:MAG: Uma2 family endonuclease [Brasilonema sp.]
MTKTLPKTKLVTFEEFVAWYPENSQHRYELYDGVIVEMPFPKGKHERVVGFLASQTTSEFLRLKLPYFIPKTVIIKPPLHESGYSPDVLIINNDNLVNEPVWEDESFITQAASISLAIEVVSQCVARVPRVEATDEPVRVSTNWRDDYLKKYADYEEMGIREYWIVDYAALGGREFIGDPKQPTILVCSLDEGEYRVTKFRGDDRIVSPTFPELTLTAQQIFNAGT